MAAKKSMGKSEPKAPKETPKKAASKPKKQMEDDELEDEEDDDENESVVSKKSAKPVAKKGKDDDDDEESDEEEVDDWESPRKMTPGIPILKNSIFPNLRLRKPVHLERKPVRETMTISRWTKISKTWIFSTIQVSTTKKTTIKK